MRKGFGIGQPQSKAVALGALTFALWNQTAVADVTYRATYDYDELGRRIRERNAANTIVASYTYDRNGNLISITDALGRRTELSYDALRRVTQSKDAAGSITSYAYDAAGRAVQVIDPRGLATRYDYDGFGSLWTQTSPDSGVTQFTYDAAGQLTRMTRADGSGLDYQYDGLGRLTSYGRGWEYRSFAYDNCAYGKGRLCHALAADSQLGTSTDTYLAYTAQGNTASKREVTADWSESRDHTVLYGYDGLGRLSSISYPSGVSVDYGYADGHLSAMTVHTSDGSQAVVSGARYQPFGSAESWLYGNGLTRRYNHDLDGRLTGISAGTPTSIMQSLTYGYNAGNEITAITNGVNSAFSQAYEYDSLSRLTRASRSLQEERFTYDANGNRLRHAIVNAQTSGIGPQPYPIAPTTAPTRAITSQEFVLEYESGSNRLLRRSGPDGSTNYRYNQQGHRIATQSDGAASYTGAFDQNYQYDTFNRLIGVGIQGAMDATYLYNALDQRVATGHFSSLNATFVYADQNRLLGELGTSGEWKDYLWFGDELVGVVDGGWRLSYVHPDHLGRPEVATDGNRQPVWRAGNHAFGREILQDAIGGLKLGFPGQYWDEGGGFWHNGMRDYDDEVGRYLQTDPAGLVAGTNTYAYASGNPITSLDPAGLDDFNLIPRKEPMHSWVNNYRDGPRILSIAVHAMPGRFFVNGRLISGRALFDLLSKDPKFVEQLAQADAVQLNSCRSGKTDEEGYNAAQDFADAAGKPTYAPQQWNWRRPDGSFFIGGAIGGESKNGWDHGYDGNLIFWPSGAQ